MRQFDEELKKAKKLFTQKMDARQNLYDLLQKFFDRHGYVPLKYLPDWNAFQKDTRPWRKIPGVQRRLEKAARKTARNAIRKIKGETPRQSMKIKRYSRVPRATRLAVEKIRKDQAKRREEGKEGEVKIDNPP